MFNPSAFENSRPDGVSVLEIVDDGAGRAEQPRRFVPLQRTKLEGEIVGPLASLRLSQTYRFSSEQSDKVLEAVYRFPLPGDAAVMGVRARFGEVEIIAELQERTKAEAGYAEAKTQGRQAALLTRESPDVFTLQVAGIQPDQDITIETSYVQLARAEGQGWSLRIPLTTSPRYVRGDESASRHAHGQPLLVLRDPGHRFALDLTLSASDVKSPTHSLATTNEEGRVRIKLQEGEILPDRDCVLTWRPVQEAEQLTFQATLHDDPAAGHTYFLGLLAPPARKIDSGISREVVLLVDHSGSMQGPKWEAADWAVKRFLGELTERDSFALGLFHDRTIWLGKGLRSANAKNVAAAVAFLDEHKDQGGTELGVALEQALDCPRGTGDAARHVLIITDAEVTDAGRILRLAEGEAKKPQRRRIDVLCIDAAPNTFLARELAERGGGVSKFLTSRPDEEDIATALDEVLADWTQPVVTGLRLEVNRGSIEAAGHAVLESGTSKAIDLGDVPAGRSVWVAGRIPRSDAKELTFRVLTPANREVAVSRMNGGGKQNALPALKALFGARRVLGLEFLISSGYEGAEFNEQLTRLGYHPHEVLADQPEQKAKVYAENAQEDASKRLKRLLVREALNYGLACSETAFIATRSEAGKPVERTVVIANALPLGWSDRMAGIVGSSTMTAACFMAPQALYAAADDDMDEMLADSSVSFSEHRSRSILQTLTAPIRRLGAKLLGGSAPAEPPATSTAASMEPTVNAFAGVPTFDKGEAVLFDTTRDSDAAYLPDDTTLVRLQVEFPNGTPDAASLDSGLVIKLYVDDPATPRAQVRLTDLVRQGGIRPLNLARRSGERVRIVLVDVAGTWIKTAPSLRVSLQWG